TEKVTDLLFFDQMFRRILHASVAGLPHIEIGNPSAEDMLPAFCRVVFLDALIHFKTYRTHYIMPEVSTVMFIPVAKTKGILHHILLDIFPFIIGIRVFAAHVYNPRAKISVDRIERFHITVADSKGKSVQLIIHAFFYNEMKVRNPVQNNPSYIVLHK